MTAPRAPIVVGVDGSDTARAAVAWAAHAAHLHERPLRIVSALGAPTPYGDGIRLPQSYFVDRDRAVHTYLDDAAHIARTEAPDIDTTTDVLEGPARPALLDAASSAHLIVVGSRGLGRVTAALAGSVAVALTAHAHCPVVVVRNRAVPVVGDVLVGVDGTDNSRPALAAAFDEATLRGRTLAAVHTWSPLSMSTAFDDQLDLPWDEVEVAEQAVLAESLAGWTDRYPDTPVTRAVVRGNTAAILSERSVDAELLVVGSHGRGGFAGMLLGSTSTTLLHTVSCPLMIVRTTSGRPHTADQYVTVT
ncbi:universal stress protein [Prescottella subtropica]|uniref:universal stress protein n=1 Tax=Prescottella subtropica TaxID=2545757 RepID=UPI0010F84162|nr:universal stress protein [Prescottella subtropica]